MRRASGQLEDSIVHVLGQESELPVAEVRNRLDPSLAHTTVMTALVRLTNKGAVVRRRRGRKFVYSLAVPIERLPAFRAALRMRSELDDNAERSMILANFVAALDPEDEAVLLDLLSSNHDTTDGS